MKKARDLKLKPGEHDSNSAAEVLGVSKLKLLKTLREVGFLQTDTKHGMAGDRHNLPRDGIKRLGWAYTQKLTFGDGPNRERNREYYIVIFTRRGFLEVKKIMQDPDGYEMPEMPPIDLQTQITPAGNVRKRTIKQRAEAAHRSYLKDLKNIGIEIDGSVADN
ncbi:hypothetical protein FKG94_03205 [Exilibacterium tricleocarpae]|uniref:Antirepressor protein C-terminal domain-containing protein n=1 Tax=Exilibacterium tricleocarpae TaxID=2591008 RepID=A0A545U6U7_9GAMM|nr:hypothetical protein [Exilibacterium tricleocarpae]TQV85211.1 hypothetical protein FKG94_03205 [Exilibacterium tricleocarpae]